ncbi:MAG: ATP-binding protein [Ignavibacteriales bacterium]|nr:ATP-binding protein [Ignavibacteriales bacterium]
MQKSFRRSVKSLESVFSFIADFFRTHNVNDDVAFTVKFAVEELFTNLVKYNPSSQSEISLNLEIEGRNIVVRITDTESQPFDPTKSPEPDLQAPLEKRRAGGLGIFLVKRMIDRIEYHHTDKMSTITLVHSLEK